MMPNVFGMTDYNTLVKNDRPAGQPHHLGTWPAKETYDQGTATLMPGGWYGGGPWPMATASDVNGSWPSQYSTWNTDWSVNVGCLATRFEVTIVTNQHFLTPRIKWALLLLLASFCLTNAVFMKIPCR